MAKNYANRAWMTTATAGTGTITLGSSKAGYVTFAEAGVANADTVSYVLVDGNNFEMGTGTYTSAGTTMSRDTVILSKSGATVGTAKITLSGAAEVFLTPGEADLAFTDLSNTFTMDQTIYSTDAGAGWGPGLYLDRNSASPAASDIIGFISFKGRDSVGASNQYASIYGSINNATNGSETGTLSLSTLNNGSDTTNVVFYGGNYAYIPSSVGTYPYWDFYNTTADADGPYMNFMKARGASVVQSGDAIGRWRWWGYDGSAYQKAAEIRAEVDTTPGAGDMPGRLVLSVSPDGAASLANNLMVTNTGLLRNAQNAGANNGVVPAVFWTSLTADYTLGNVGTSQKAFNNPANGTLTLPTGVYRFRCLLYITGMSATSGNISFSVLGAGTATMDRVGFASMGLDNTTPTTAAAGSFQISVGAATANPIAVAGTGTGLGAVAEGIFRVSAAGTIIPSVTLNTAVATANVKAGSHFMCEKIGESADTSIGNWS